MPGMYPIGPINKDRHERLKEITAIIEYFDVVTGVDVDAMKLVGFLLDDSGMLAPYGFESKVKIAQLVKKDEAFEIFRLSR